MEYRQVAPPIVETTERDDGKPASRVFDVTVNRMADGCITESKRMVGGQRRVKYSAATYLEWFAYHATGRTVGEREAWGLHSKEAAVKALLVAVGVQS